MPKKKKLNIAALVVIALILVVSLWGINWMLLDWPTNQRGTLGDMFGVVNALFSGLAFAGIILTIYMQKHELEMQRNELEETREVFKTQTEMMNHQQYDATFFSLLENHRNLIDSLKQGLLRYSALGESKTEIRDEISGYAYIEKLMTQWQNTFNSFLMASEDHLLVHPIHTKYNTIKKFLDDSPKMRNLVMDINHVYLFVHRQMKTQDQEFYNDTLWHNLSEGEKFVFEMFSVYYPEMNKEIGHELLVYPKYNYPDFNLYKLPVVHLDNLEVEDDEILKISSSSDISHVAYFTFYDEGKTVSVFDQKELIATENKSEWYFDLNTRDIAPKDLNGQSITPSVGIVVKLNYQNNTYHFFAEIAFELELEDATYEISQNGWKPMPHRLAKQLSKLI